MAVIWQSDNKNSNQRLQKKKDQNHYFLTVVHFAIECELSLQKQYLFVGM